MARYRGPTCRLSRREGTDLELKSRVRSIETKCHFDRPPGQHGSAGARRRLSDYGNMLREKQKLRRIYGLMEKQFRKHYQEASRRRGSTGDNLLQILESRLDNLVYRMGFGSTRSESRQLVSHKSITVNERVANVPSMEIKVGDVVAVRDRSKSQVRIADSLKCVENLGFVEWVEVNVGEKSAVLQRLPERSEVYADINESLVIELYSK
ncbi:MAG: 30S ribosomal protein S4 [Candidatus Porifericomitaceae bacterium WSBS_2022_MAG_OTU9]